MMLVSLFVNYLLSYLVTIFLIFNSKKKQNLDWKKTATLMYEIFDYFVIFRESMISFLIPRPYI